MTPDERLASLNLLEQDKQYLHNHQDSIHEQLVENYISDLNVPIGILKDIQLNGKSYNVPMAIEEPSVIAAANYGAKLLKTGGGIKATLSSPTVMIGQIMFKNIDFEEINIFVKSNQVQLFKTAQMAKPSIYKRGGGLKSVHARQVSKKQVSIDFMIDTKDAMGANIVNTILEAELVLFNMYESNIVGAILSNYATAQVVTITGSVAIPAVGGKQAAQKIVELSEFGQNDCYRATTENKGTFNGISAVVLATGNDWRAVEAGGHAYASRHGKYQSLTSWHIDGNLLVGTLKLPISVGIVGGAISAMPQSQINLAICNIDSADELRSVIGAVGLAQNLAALKAIANGGIQRGHMRMQYRALALQIGANKNEIPELVSKLVAEAYVDESIAKMKLMELRNET